ncbi:class D sortase [Planococcus maritimus]|nr:class D sortase [Planococcus sp. SK3692]MDE4085201.1 class D sortase [Planococcus maritimus]
MNKVYTIIIIAGLSMTGYFGFQWWQSAQAAETVSMEEIEGWNNAASNPMTSTTEPASERSLEPVQEPTPIMSNDMDDYEPGEEVGRLVIPSIEMGYSTYWGADEATLDQGVGMYVSEWTTTPDQQRHTVLSGHRDTVFTGLEEMEKGDSVFLEYEGQRYEYAIEEIWITDAEDRTVIVDKDEATLTLTTCYPFDYIGYAPDRYIIQGSLVEIQEIQ